MNQLNHVAIIMDGNGRWGLKKKNNRNYGHKEGLKTLEKIIKQSIKLKIKYLTLFTFSTENWKRPIKEINYLFRLLENFLKTKLTKIDSQDIKLKFIGEFNFDKKLKNLIKISENKTKKNQTLQINVALNYGSKKEILIAFKNILKKKINISERNLEKNLFTNKIPNPEILIRTGNQKRLSNFLLWQIAYTEIFFEKKLWPDFSEIDFTRIINAYKKINRNFGDI